MEVDEPEIRKWKLVFKKSAGSDEDIQEIFVPRNYSPDRDDKFYRASKDGDYFHAIAKGQRMSSYIVAGKFDVQNNDKPKRVVMKRYPVKELDNHQAWSKLKKEIENFRFLAHENIATFYEKVVEMDQLCIEPTHIWIVIERMDYTLERFFEHLSKNDRDSVKPLKKRHIWHVASLMTQMLRGLDHLHQRGITHGNVCPRSIGICPSDFVVKFLDIGRGSEPPDTREGRTQIYDAPEMFEANSVCDVRVDVWAAAVVAVEMLGEKLMKPDGEETTATVARRINRMATQKSGNEMCEDLKEQLGRATERLEKDMKGLDINQFNPLIASMLAAKPGDRPRCDLCLQDRFLKKLNQYYEKQRPQDSDKKALLSMGNSFFGSWLK